MGSLGKVVLGQSSLGNQLPDVSFDGDSSIAAELSLLFTESGVTAGAGDVSPGLLALSMDLSGTTAGSGSISAANFIQTILLFGHAEGEAIVEDNSEQDLSGTTTGAAINTGTVVLLHSLSGHTFGVGNLHDSAPLPIVGVGTTTGFLEKEHVHCPVDCKALPIPKVFRWGYLFTRGDLTLYVTDPFSAGRVSPAEVTYTIYQVLANGSMRQAGASDRKPVVQQAGEFYATGTAGEFGQPGDFAIVWKYRVSFNDPVVSETARFRVVDAVLGPIPGDPTCRVIKYGWS